jgi:hypothetical protein
VSIAPLPSDFIHEPIAPENLVHDRADKRIHPPVAMHVNASIHVQQIPHQNQPFINHRDERIRASSPSVAVGDLFEQIGLLVEGLAADLNVHGEVRADVEGRVDVDELEAAGVLDLAAQRARLERGEDELVVAPDEFVGPALGLAARGVEEFFIRPR